MNSWKPKHRVGLAIGLLLVLYAVYTHLEFFGDITFLGGVLLLEVLIAALWKFDERFFLMLMVAFLWAGMHLPLQGAWTAGRWLVLAAGAIVGYVIWVKDPRKPFGLIHLLAVFCAAAAFVSATVSPFFQMAVLKALSLFLLFLYCCSGARLAVIGREQRFLAGIVWASELVVYATALCYFAIGLQIWGNPNSMGAATSIGLFPVLLWGWLTSDGVATKVRRLFALLLCASLVFVSLARAGMFSIVLVTLVFCVCLHQYRLLIKTAAFLLFGIAVAGMLSPSRLESTGQQLRDSVVYKGHKEQGLFGSRMTPWQKSVETIKSRPWFGTGYGTSPTGDDPGLNFGTVASSAETSREHGSGYMTITEWVGLLGVVPFAAILLLNAGNVWRVCAWMVRTADPRHSSIPIAMVVLSGLVHANFEDWLFAVGAYPCVYFWVFAFMLADLVPARSQAREAVLGGRIMGPVPAGVAAVVSATVISR